MAAGDILLDANGNVILDADGDVMLSDGVGDGCCCGTPCTGCQTTSVTVTFSDVLACWTGCDGFKAHHNGSSLDGTYSLTYQSVCTYSRSMSGPIVLSLYENNGCAGALCAGWPVDQISITLTRNSGTGQWTLTATMGGVNLFHSGAFYPPNCPSLGDECDDWCWTKTVSNTVSACNSGHLDSTCASGMFGPYNSGGTATITVGTG